MTGSRPICVFTLLSAGFIALMAVFYWLGLVAVTVATAIAVVTILYAASMFFFSRCLNTGCVKSGGCRSCLIGVILMYFVIVSLTPLLGLVATFVVTVLYATSVVFFSRCLDDGCVKSSECRSCLVGAILMYFIIAFLTVLLAAHLALP